MFLIGIHLCRSATRLIQPRGQCTFTAVHCDPSRHLPAPGDAGAPLQHTDRQSEEGQGCSHVLAAAGVPVISAGSKTGFLVLIGHSASYHGLADPIPSHSWWPSRLSGHLPGALEVICSSAW